MSVRELEPSDFLSHMRGMDGEGGGAAEVLRSTTAVVRP
jgi:hypothetical protein